LSYRLSLPLNTAYPFYRPHVNLLLPHYAPLICYLLSILSSQICLSIGTVLYQSPHEPCSLETFMHNSILQEHDNYAYRIHYYYIEYFYFYSISTI